MPCTFYTNLYSPPKFVQYHLYKNFFLCLTMASIFSNAQLTS